MHLFFVDESGTLAKPGKGSGEHFVLAGVVIPEAVWRPLAEEMSRIKDKYNVVGEVKWRNFSMSNHDSTNNLAKLSQKDRYEFRDALYESLTRYKSVKIIAISAHRAKSFEAPYIKTTDDLYRLCYKQLTERFQYHLQDQGREVGSSINGIVIIDHRMSQDDARLRSDHHSLVSTDSEYSSKYKNLIEGLFVAPSHLSVGIQFADIVAGAIYRKIEKQDDHCYNQIAKAFRASATGQIEGYGLITWPKGK